ncbi:hypothetical protein [Sedimentibacter sp.]|uniref:hypothetical protein n=1 Tax=Sedimentibacter sp. TaxID=1960295 RepID=UPI0028A5857E|nr:hypothetical protein [Sedimentibacter sp.]
MALDLVRMLVGQVPEEFVMLEYVAAIILALFTVKFIYEMFMFVLNLVSKLNNK